MNISLKPFQATYFFFMQQPITTILNTKYAQKCGTVENVFFKRCFKGPHLSLLHRVLDILNKILYENSTWLSWWIYAVIQFRPLLLRSTRSLSERNSRQIAQVAHLASSIALTGHWISRESCWDSRLRLESGKGLLKSGAGRPGMVIEFGRNNSFVTQSDRTGTLGAQFDLAWVGVVTKPVSDVERGMRRGIVCLELTDVWFNASRIRKDWWIFKSSMGMMIWNMVTWWYHDLGTFSVIPSWLYIGDRWIPPTKGQYCGALMFSVVLTKQVVEQTIESTVIVDAVVLT